MNRRFRLAIGLVLGLAIAPFALDAATAFFEAVRVRVSKSLEVTGSIKYVDGNQASGSVLTSDASGNAAWATPVPGGGGGTIDGSGAATQITVWSDPNTIMGDPGLLYTDCGVCGGSPDPDRYTVQTWVGDSTGSAGLWLRGAQDSEGSDIGGIRIYNDPNDGSSEKVAGIEATRGSGAAVGNLALGTSSGASSYTTRVNIQGAGSTAITGLVEATAAHTSTAGTLTLHASTSGAGASLCLDANDPNGADVRWSALASQSGPFVIRRACGSGAGDGSDDYARLDPNALELLNTKGITVPEQSASWTPASGTGHFYFGTDGRPHAVNSAGMDMLLGGVATAATMQFVGEQVLTAAATSMTVSNLDLQRDQVYKAYIRIKTSGSAGSISMYVSGDTTATNYYSQVMSASGTSGIFANNNSAVVQGAVNNLDSIFELTMTVDVSGRARALLVRNLNTTTSLNSGVWAWYRTVVGNVTSITFQSSAANDMQINSSVRVYKIGPPSTVPAAMTSAMQLVQEQQVSGSAATSVTFSNLDLARDQEYRLVAYVKNASGSTAVLSQYVNADTTATNYYSQFISGSSTTVTGGRNNAASIGSIATGINIHFEINITRDADGYPRSLVRWNRNAPASLEMLNGTIVRNNTANLTSLTIQSDVASAIAIGSTFRLYRISSQAPAIAGPVPSDFEGVRFVYTDPNTVTLTPSGPDGKAYVHVVDAYNNELMLTLSTSLTASFALSGCGGRATGSDSVGGWYVWLWAQASGLSPCLTLDTSGTSPTAPSNGIYKRLVFFVRNGNSSSAANLVPFVHSTGAKAFRYAYTGTDDPPALLSAGTSTTAAPGTAVDLTGFCPSTGSGASIYVTASTSDATAGTLSLYTGSSASTAWWSESIGTGGDGSSKAEVLDIPLGGTLSTSLYYTWSAARTGRSASIYPRGCALN